MKKFILLLSAMSISALAQDVASLGIVIKVVDSSAFTTAQIPVSFPTKLLVFAKWRQADQPIELTITDDKGIPVRKMITLPGCNCTGEALSQKYRQVADINLGFDQKIILVKAIRMSQAGNPETLVLK